MSADSVLELHDSCHVVWSHSDREHFEQETKHVREKILTLPDCVILYTGHGPSTTVATEKAYNPFFD